MKYEHIIWDWNGTIVNDTEICVHILNFLLRNANLTTINESFYKHNFFFPVKKFYESLGLAVSGDKYRDLSEEFIAMYRNLAKNIELQPNFLTTLEKLRTMGVELSILSAGKLSDICDFLIYHKLYEYFDHVSGVENIFADGKKQIALKHRSQIDLNHRKIVLVGDTVHDSEIADLIGVDCILFSGGHNTREKLLRCNKQLISDFTQLLPLID